MAPGGTADVTHRVPSVLSTTAGPDAPMPTARQVAGTVPAAQPTDESEATPSGTGMASQLPVPEACRIAPASPLVPTAQQASTVGHDTEASAVTELGTDWRAHPLVPAVATTTGPVAVVPVARHVPAAGHVNDVNDVNPPGSACSVQLAPPSRLAAATAPAPSVASPTAS